MVNDSTNISKTNNHLSPNLTEHEAIHNVGNTYTGLG